MSQRVVALRTSPAAVLDCYLGPATTVVDYYPGSATIVVDYYPGSATSVVDNNPGSATIVVDYYPGSAAIVVDNNPGPPPTLVEYYPICCCTRVSYFSAPRSHSLTPEKTELQKNRQKRCYKVDVSHKNSCIVY